MKMFAAFFCSGVCAMLVLAMEALAPKLGLTDRPAGRKHHRGEIPVVGGIAILGSVTFTALLFDNVAVPPTLIILCAFILLVGVADDIISLRIRFKLFSQIAVAWVMVSVADIRVESIGSILGNEPIFLHELVSTVFTIVCIVGVINAVNMIDGIDGLAGSLLLISFAAIAILSSDATDVGQTTFLVCLVSSLLVFLFYNCRLGKNGARVFLGDSGSLMLGLMLSWYLIDLSKSETYFTSYSPVIMMWLFGLMLMETLVLIANRILDKRSPFAAGRDHMHHKLTSAGLSVNATVFVMGSAHFVIVCIGVVASDTQVTDAFLFWSFCIVTVFYFGISRYVLKPENSTLQKSIQNFRRGRVG